MITNDDLDAMASRIEDLAQIVEATVANRMREEVKTLRSLLNADVTPPTNDAP